MAFQNTKIQLVSIGLAAVLCLAYLGNQQNFIPKNVTQTRGIASVGTASMASTSPADILQLIAENDLAQEISKPSAKRGLATMGEPATGLDSLKFGALEGKYDVKLSNDHVSEIAFIEKQDEKPTVLPDRVGFLSKFAEQFGAVSKPKRLSVVSQGEHLIETYRIKSAHGPDRIVQMTIGSQNSFLTLKTEEAPTLRLF